MNFFLKSVEVRLRRTFSSVLQHQAAWAFDPLAWCFLLKSGLRPAVRLRRLSPAKPFLGQDVDPHIRLVLNITHDFAGDPKKLII